MSEQDTAEKQTKPRLTKAQWRHISGIWELGEMTLAQLSDKFGAAPETISRKMKEFGVVRGSKAEQHRALVQQELAKTEQQRAEQLAADIQDAKQGYVTQQRALNRLAMNEITQAAKNKTPLALVDPNLKSIERAQKINAATRNELWKIWGINEEEETDDDLPELTIRVLSDSEVDTIRQEQLKKNIGGMDDLILDTDIDAALDESQ